LAAPPIPGDERRRGASEVARDGFVSERGRTDVFLRLRYDDPAVKANRQSGCAAKRRNCGIPQYANTWASGADAFCRHHRTKPNKIKSITL
jgi:hypothetical protein